MRWKHCPELKWKLNSKSRWWGQAAGVDHAASSWRGSSRIFFSFFFLDDLSLSRVRGYLWAVHSAFSESAWYVLFILMWIQGVTPATLTAVGVLRTVNGPFQCGAKESCLTHTWFLGTNLWISSPRGSGTLSYTNLVTWFITLPSCSICCEISSPLTWGKFVDTCFIMGGGLPYTISYGE